MRLLNKLLSFTFVVVFISMSVVTEWSCKGKSDTFLPNIPPITQLSNVPPTDSVITSSNPRLTLYWKGDDPDGYIIAYKYRWTYPINGVVQTKPWSTILNLGIIIKDQSENFALMIDTSVQNSEAVAPAVYKYFSTLDLTDTTLINGIADVLNRGDSLTVEGVKVFASNPSAVRFPVHINPNSGTFIFDSQDSINFHIFEIQAVDNLGDTGHAATIRFNTLRIQLPHTAITSSPSGDDNYVLDKPTDTWAGLQFSFQGIDPNSRALQFSWNIDSINTDGTLHSQNPNGTLRWSPWDDATSAKVTASDFHVVSDTNEYTTTHIFSVRSRNEFGSIDTAGFFIHNCPPVGARCETTYASVKFKTLYPPFKRPSYSQRILLVNASYERDPALTSVSYPSRQMLDNYYDSVFSAAGKTNFDVYHAWDLNVDSFKNQAPRLFSQYSVVFMYFDTYDTSNNPFAPNYGGLLPSAKAGALAGAIKNYCFIGGKVIISAWNLLGYVNGLDDFKKIIHVDQIRFVDDNPDYRELFELAGGDADINAPNHYPNAVFDTSKFDTSWHGALNLFASVTPRGFGESIYKFRAVSVQLCLVLSNQLYCFPGQPIGTRYKGLTYNVIYYGFPLYFVQKNNAVAILQHTLSDIHE